MSMSEQQIATLGAQIRAAAACQHCRGQRWTERLTQGQGIVRGPCPTCLGDGHRRALPDDKAARLLMWQGKGDGSSEGFAVSGMLAVPAEDGVTYVTREDAVAFFGLVEVQPDAAALQRRIAELEEEEVRVSDKLLEARNAVIAEIPGCGAHGEQCLPHAREWIEAARARGTQGAIDRLQVTVELMDCGRTSEARQQIAGLLAECRVHPVGPA